MPGFAAPERAAVTGWRAFFAPALAVWLALLTTLALAASYPALTGRIVDQAGMLNAGARAEIEAKLVALEEKSGIQLVVATVKSLDGDAVESYANGLFRFWKLGEKAKNNGALLLVSQQDRKVRVEVGYGLEGTLTDAMSKIIIANAIVPRFKAGDYAGGITRGVDDIVATLSTDSGEWGKRPRVRAEDQPSLFDTLMPMLVMLIFAIVILSMIRNATTGGGRMMRRGGNVIFIPTGGFGGGFGGGGFGGGGGFSGGGGSSGGGGASGDW
jgi:uncharacterized protein